MYVLVCTSHFDRRIARFKRLHPEVKPRLAQALRDLEEDPFQPHLRGHPLKGEFEGLFAVRVTFAYRMTLAISQSDSEIILLDVGSHDDMYR